MAKYDDYTLDFAKRCFRKLKSLPYCSEVSTLDIIGQVMEEDNLTEMPDEMQVHYALSDLIRSDSAFVMDNTKYFMQCVGLPYAIPYFFRPKHPLGWAIFRELLLLAQSSNEDEATAYAREIVEISAWDYKGCEIPISLNQTFIWLERAFRKNCRLKVVPNEEFQEGGIKQDQCDGWRYHYELDIDKPPVY